MRPGPAPLPSDESGRLAALRRYEILDSTAETAYDDLVAVACQVCGVPIALITLVDEHRQWFKARRGLDLTETPREHSFCAHAVADGAFLEVPDAQADPRFADNPLVVGEPGIRSYAGAPLVTPDGYALGTICVIDREPRRLTPAQREALDALARQVVRLFEHRQVMGALVEVTSALDEFSSRTAHDLKNPIAAMRGYADVLRRRRDDLDEETRREILDRLVALAGRTTVMIDEVLMQARAGTSGVRGACESGQVVVDVLASAALHDAEVTVDPPPAEWPRLASSVVDVECILANLVSNASHYGRGPDGRLRLDLGVVLAEGMAVISVHDRGGGVDPSIRDEVFEPFVNGPDSVAANPQSSGLGLALVRRVAQVAGGDVALADDGPGSRFVVTLPVADSARA